MERDSQNDDANPYVNIYAEEKVKQNYNIL